MEENKLELRMYFFVNYQLTGIQKGIQCGHSALEYAKKFGNTELYKEFIDNYKTWVILNGGTTNDELDFNQIPLGDMNKIADGLYENGIDFSYFIEPDLNNALTSICFILDERVFNRKKYPNFEVFMFNKLEGIFLPKTKEEIINDYPEQYKEWVRSLGGVKNAFLRELIEDKRLA